MMRLFRSPAPGLAGYAALALFAGAYLALLALVIDPGLAGMTVPASDPVH